MCVCTKVKLSEELYITGNRDFQRTVWGYTSEMT